MNAEAVVVESNKEAEPAIDAHLAVVQHAETGLYHGAVYRNHKKPSGLDRYLLAHTTTEGFGGPKRAAEAINAGFPHLTPIDTSNLEMGPDTSTDNLIIPRGALITPIRPRDERGWENATVEAFESFHIQAKSLATPVSPTQLKVLIAQKKVALESSSDIDPNLEFQYDHYIAH